MAPVALPVRLSALPEHIGELEPADTAVGLVFTVTVTVAVLLQPAAEVPVTV